MAASHDALAANLELVAKALGVLAEERKDGGSSELEAELAALRQRHEALEAQQRAQADELAGAAASVQKLQREAEDERGLRAVAERYGEDARAAQRAAQHEVTAQAHADGARTQAHVAALEEEAARLDGCVQADAT